MTINFKSTLSVQNLRNHFNEIFNKNDVYRQVSNIRRTLVANQIIDHSDSPLNA